jgi:hypothetical protein
MAYAFSPLRKPIRAAMIAALWFSLAGTTWGQTGQPPVAPVPGAQRAGEEQTWENKQRAELAKQENVKRQQDLKKDTDKLLELATELKQYVDKTNENMLSVDVIKKAEEIEKLARNVKDKMRKD